jgi:hypothetical protein
MAEVKWGEEERTALEYWAWLLVSSGVVDSRGVEGEAGLTREGTVGEGEVLDASSLVSAP